MRVGGSVMQPYNNPDEWLAAVKELRYSAVIAPVDCNASKETIRDYVQCARENHLVFGEVGIWKNPLSPDAQESKAAKEYGMQQLCLADEIGARCCVNIAGSRGAVWDGCYMDNYADDTYTLMIDSIRAIIDAVKPKRTFYTLEPMPWMHPDSPEDYLKLLKDVDRPAFAVHLDYTNMISSVERYLHSGTFIAECFRLLGPYIKSIHAKDISITNSLPCHIREVPPGTGSIDFGLVLRLAEKLDKEMTVFVEHLSSHEAYKAACTHVRQVAKEQRLEIL